MTPIKRHLLYIFRGSLLRLRITWNRGTALTLSIGYNVDKLDSKGKPKWDGSRCRLNTTHGQDKVSATIINKALEDLEAKIDAAFYLFESQDKIPSKEELKEAINPSKKSDKGLFEAFDEYINEGEEDRFWAPITVRMTKVHKKHLYEFNQNLSFDTFDSDTLKSFVKYMTKKVRISKINSAKDNTKIEKHYNNSYINKTVNKIQAFLKWAYDKGYIKDKNSIAFKSPLKTSKRTIVYLTRNELMKIYNHDFSNDPILDIVRDGFCLCCFTSLRYSDLKNLKKSNINENSITLTTIKTNDKITIDLNSFSRSILNKYKDYDSEYAMPVISEQKMNMHLKEIAKICEIDSEVQQTIISGNKRKDITIPKHEVISTHCGRRTFICNALSMGIPPNTIMKWTGHSDYKAMEPYMEIIDEMRIQSMSYFDEYISRNNIKNTEKNTDTKHQKKRN